MRTDLMYRAEHDSIEAELTELMERHDDGSITKRERARAHQLFLRCAKALMAGMALEASADAMEASQGADPEALEDAEEEELDEYDAA